MEHVAVQMERDLRSKYSHLMIKWYEAVNWTEPLIISLLTFHVVLMATLWLTRKKLSIQFALFVLIILMATGTETINKWARENWRIFATQPYFDEQGVFMGIFYAGPLLASGFFQLILSMKNMVDMIVIVKKAEYRQQLMAKKSK
ncbi:Transmembrane protein 18 [Plasmopara halstedii]|uniref:Transmembrane protein 18 n=1 Tax=Plasmopara halstedii TaxID=4781 RepID=A0A0N7L6J9_PLAHL|nr:Transmembrane protein 18 [Plasmopara halstedii]CEG44483.1 Transmembrane protein 18 [Plasmopara halstedii]|eukprot:XP_024580852.1 Transmembrane protein 18 [Plasmopara halstedii]